jgi:hypothetical protein
LLSRLLAWFLGCVEPVLANGLLTIPAVGRF